MNLQEKLKICSMIIDKKKYNAIKFDFEKKFIASTNGHNLLKINYDFDVNWNKNAFDFFKEKKSIIFNAIYLEELNKYLDLSYNLFEILEKHFGIYEYSNHFPNIDAISFHNMQATDIIQYDTKTLLSVVKVCDKLKMQNIQLNFNGYKNPTQIKNDIAEIVFMPKY